MSIDFVGRTTMANQLKNGLDVGAQRSRTIADRVARATAEKQGFSLPAPGALSGSSEQGPIDIEQEMVSLADEQLRYQATAKLLEKTYSGLRAAMQDK